MPSPTSRPSPRHPIPTALLLAAGLAAALGCRREEIAHYRVPKEPAAAQAPAMDADDEAPAPAAPAGGASLKWTLPKGWTDEKGSGMRYATLKAPVPGKLDISITFLPGAAGGELANVNRWRGQIGLPPWDEAAIAKARTPMKSKAGSIAAFDFSSEGQARTRMVVGLLTTGAGDSWFLKMVGDEAPVAKAKPEFLRFLESVRLD